ncbi:hypothetical protein EIN_289240 [Entamoeba invadens IP1]|uniref:Uncharacterized protein n=1 Tax=Entamoeba invadens IP1 TaxID=370355 RepID=L7FMP2_ENTIV|nr:hypothetical protein EIN_289240 [Entamoeba invadens IP1]ELP86672.1 hypothetical protein EIN_289240 [Entamoeba invadens IP1]|eukprot:XP_004186018.1 hypothetical protein EIN_289240 [Entamoeba invadens IP1]
MQFTRVILVALFFSTFVNAGNIIKTKIDLSRNINGADRVTFNNLYKFFDEFHTKLNKINLLQANTDQSLKIRNQANIIRQLISDVVTTLDQITHNGQARTLNYFDAKQVIKTIRKVYGNPELFNAFTTYYQGFEELYKQQVGLQYLANELTTAMYEPIKHPQKFVTLFSSLGRDKYINKSRNYAQVKAIIQQFAENANHEFMRVNIDPELREDIEHHL